MTLNTSIRVHEPYPAKRIFNAARAIIGAVDGVHPCEHDAGGKYKGDDPSWRNPLGMGLCGILSLTYGGDGPLSRDDDPEYGPDESPEGFIEISLDTGYGYKCEVTETGDSAGCSDLHAGFITELGEWLREHHCTFAWQNEFTGEWSEGFDNLDDFGSAIDGRLALMHERAKHSTDKAADVQARAADPFAFLKPSE